MAIYSSNDNNIMPMGAPVRRAMQRQQPMTGTPPMQSQQMFTGAPTGGGGALGQVAAQIAQNPQAFAQQYGSPMQSQQPFTGAPTGGGGALGGLATGMQSQPMFSGTPGGGGALGQLASGIQSQQAFTGTPTGGGGALGGLAAPSTQAAAPQRMAAMLRAVRPSRY